MNLHIRTWGVEFDDTLLTRIQRRIRALLAPRLPHRAKLRVSFFDLGGPSGSGPVICTLRVNDEDDEIVVDGCADDALAALDRACRRVTPRQPASRRAPAAEREALATNP